MVIFAHWILSRIERKDLKFFSCGANIYWVSARFNSFSAEGENAEWYFPVGQVSTTPAAKLSMTPVARRRQTMGTISGCRYLTVNLKAKIYIYVNSSIQRCPKKIIKIFLIEDFFHLPPVSTTPVVNLELRISPRIFEKILNGSNGILRGLGETDSWKNQKSKISWHCPFDIPHNLDQKLAIRNLQ